MSRKGGRREATPERVAQMGIGPAPRVLICEDCRTLFDPKPLGTFTRTVECPRCHVEAHGGFVLQFPAPVVRRAYERRGEA